MLFWFFHDFTIPYLRIVCNIYSSQALAMLEGFKWIKSCTFAHKFLWGKQHDNFWKIQTVEFTLLSLNLILLHQAGCAYETKLLHSTKYVGLQLNLSYRRYNMNGCIHKLAFTSHVMLSIECSSAAQLSTELTPGRVGRWKHECHHVQALCELHVSSYLASLWIRLIEHKRKY